MVSEEVVIYYSKRIECAGSTRIFEILRSGRLWGGSFVCVEDLIEVLAERGETLPEWIDGTPICVELASDRDRLVYRGTDAVDYIRARSETSGLDPDPLPSNAIAAMAFSHDERPAQEYVPREREYASREREREPNAVSEASSPRGAEVDRSNGRYEQDSSYGDGEVDIRSMTRGRMVPGIDGVSASSDFGTPGDRGLGEMGDGSALDDENDEIASSSGLDSAWTIDQGPSEEEDERDKTGDGSNAKVTADMVAIAMRERKMIGGDTSPSAGGSSGSRSTDD